MRSSRKITHLYPPFVDAHSPGFDSHGADAATSGFAPQANTAGYGSGGSPIVDRAGRDVSRAGEQFVHADRSPTLDLLAGNDSYSNTTAFGGELPPPQGRGLEDNYRALSLEEGPNAASRESGTRSKKQRGSKK